MPLDPQVQEYLSKLAALGEEPMSAASPETARALMELETRTLGRGPAVGRSVDRTIPGPAGPIPIRITTPVAEAEAEDGGPLPVLVLFHGGGWVAGSIRTHDALARALTSGAGVAVVSVEYRRAPEHRFPAALDDAFAAITWVAAHGAELGLDPERIAVGGDSAGGNLAAAVTLKGRDEGGPPLAFQLLVYPITNDDLDTPSYREFAQGYMLTRDAMIWYWDQYVPDPSRRCEPYVSPLRAADLRGLPPALVVTAEYDVLRDEAEAYAARLAEAGVPTRLYRGDGLIHGFLRRTAKFVRARTVLDDLCTILTSALRNAPARYERPRGVSPGES